MSKKNSLKSYVELIKNAQIAKKDKEEAFLQLRQRMTVLSRRNSYLYSYVIDELSNEFSQTTETIVVNKKDLEKYPALKEAYENYRLTEKLCIGGKRHA